MSLPAPLTREPTAEALITGFYQKGEGNCVSIAAIKAALMAFGTRPVFAAARDEGGVYHVTMRDGRELAFTRDDLRTVRGGCGFEGDDAALTEHAVFMLAAMARRAQVEGNDGNAGMSFPQALESLNDGEDWREGPHWLGLRAFVVPGPDGLPGNAVKRFAREHRAVIAQSPRHTWFASEGVHDNYGDVHAPSGNFAWLRSPFRFMNGALALDVEKIRALP